MAVYLFTLHSYGSWLPDRARGYFKRGEGVLPRDDMMAGYYREDMNAGVVVFNRAMQAQIIQAITGHCDVKAYRLYQIATDSTHVHVLIGWEGYVKWESARRSLKHSISSRLNQQFGKRQWLTRGGSRKRVEHRKYFDYLMTKYLPSHRGVKWCCE